MLAKAEATEFAAEAETFTAKAQDLMTRHAIDEALLRAAGDGPIEIRGVRVHIHNPYAAEKVQLLNQVARANRARAVWNKPLGLVTVLGTPVDVDQVEMLFTSLLIQATRAMAEAGTRRAGCVRPLGLVSPVVPDGVRGAHRRAADRHQHGRRGVVRCGARAAAATADRSGAGGVRPALPEDPVGPGWAVQRAWAGRPDARRPTAPTSPPAG